MNAWWGQVKIWKGNLSHLIQSTKPSDVNNLFNVSAIVGENGTDLIHY